MGAPLLALALLGAAAVAAAPAPEVPEGCRVEAPRLYACAWTFDATAGPTETYAVPFPSVALATLEIGLESEPATYWSLGIRTTDGEFVYCASDWPDQLRRRLLVELPPAPLELVASQSECGTASPPLVQVPARATVTALVREHVGAVAPTAPAGGAGDPHVLDRQGDAPADAPYTDIAAVWFDDAFLDDGVFEIGVLVPRLAEAPPEDSDAAGLTQVQVDVIWKLLGDESELDFSLGADGWDAHVHFQRTHETADIAGNLLNDGEDVAVRVDPGNGTLVALVPVAFLGDPPEGALFEDIRARSYRYAPEGRARPDDVASGESRPFALGGPEIWATLRDDAGPVVAAETAPWYLAPLHPANLLDTVQAAAFGAAVVTGTTGYVLVRRRRERLNRLLAEIDDAAAALPSQEALRRLADLERGYDAMLLSGKLDEKHHDVLLRRIERAGYRLAREPTAPGAPP